MVIIGSGDGIMLVNTVANRCFSYINVNPAHFLCIVQIMAILVMLTILAFSYTHSHIPSPCTNLAALHCSISILLIICHLGGMGPKLLQHELFIA